MTIPRSLVGRELLLSSCVSSTTHYKYAEVGTRPNVFVGRFQVDGNRLMLRRLNVQYVCDDTSPSERRSFADNYADLYLASFPITTYDNHSFTIDATNLFLGGSIFSPFPSRFRKADVSYNATLSRIESCKSFADNFSVKVRLSYNFTPRDKSERAGICTRMEERRTCRAFQTYSLLSRQRFPVIVEGTSAKWSAPMERRISGNGTERRHPSKRLSH